MDKKGKVNSQSFSSGQRIIFVPNLPIFAPTASITISSTRKSGQKKKPLELQHDAEAFRGISIETDFLILL